jgi:PAS domain S-box-containing protein
MAGGIHETERALRESEEKLALAAGVTGIGIFDRDMGTGEILATAQNMLILGMQPKAAGLSASHLSQRYHSRQWAACVHPEDLARVQAEIGRSLAERSPYESEYRVIWPDGTRHWIVSRGIFQYDSEGRAQRLIGIQMDVTEKKSMEIALRQSQERLLGALNSGRVFTFQWDRKSDVVLRSWNASQVLGFDSAGASRASGKEYLRRVFEEDREAFLGTIRRLSPVTPEYKTKYRFVRDDGRVIWLEESAAAEFDEDRRVTIVRGIVADVTDRVASAEIEKQRAVLDSALQSELRTANAMEEGVIILRLDGTVISVNQSFERLTGMAAEQFAGKNLTDVMPQFLRGGDAAAVNHALEELAAGRIPKIKDMIFRQGSGLSLCMRASAAVIESQYGTPTSAVLRLSDVTELRRSGELLARLFDEAQQEIAHFDREFTILSVNRAYAASHGHDRDFFVGKRYFDLYPQADKDRIFRQVRDTGVRLLANEMVFNHPDHPELGTRYCDCSILPVKDEHGDVEGLLMCLIDVTERVLTRRKLADEEQRYVQKLRQLAERVASTEEDHRRRVAGLVHDTVIQTMALSHIRLGTVMTAVEGAGLVEQRKKLDGVRQLLDKGIAEARTLMEELVPSMLYEVGLAAALRDFAEKQSKLDGTPIIVEAELQHEPIDEAQRGVLFQCARELIMNALKYAGQCEIKVTLAAVDGNLTLEVRDTGRGFDPGTLSSSKKPGRDGGFGLFSIRERLGRLGGRLEIDSVPGSGTTARMAMPLKSGIDASAAAVDAIAESLAECEGADAGAQASFDFESRQKQR